MKSVVRRSLGTPVEGHEVVLVRVERSAEGVEVRFEFHPGITPEEAERPRSTSFIWTCTLEDDLGTRYTHTGGGFQPEASGPSRGERSFVPTIHQSVVPSGCGSTHSMMR